MRLDKIRLVNYRCYADTTIEFSPQFNVLIGANGSGKTSLLRAISESFFGLTASLSLHRPWPIAEDDARIERVDTAGQVRFEPRYPVEISATATFMAQAALWSLQRRSTADSTTVEGFPTPGTLWSEASAARGDNLTLPLLAFYRANRQWQHAQPNAIAAATEKNSRLDAYGSYWDASSDGDSLQAWAISKSLERFQVSSETGKTFGEIHNDELALVNFALAAAIPEVEGIRYDMREKSLLVEWKESAGLSERYAIFSNLSDGQRAIVGLVADIARRMCLLNSHLGEHVIRDTPGIVLIDELDIHLHPKWQRTLTTGLQAAFPSLQFIVASHSPQVLSEMQPEQIIVLGGDSARHPQVSYGLDSSAVLEEIMDAPKRPESVSSALSSLFDSLERNDLQAARDQMDVLRKDAPGIPELIRAEAMLKRKEVIGR